MVTPKVKFVFDRRKTASNVRQGSVELEINYSGKQKFFATGILVYPKQWNNTDKCCKGENAVENNKDLDLIYKKVKEILRQMEDEGNIDLNSVPQILKGKLVDKTFYDFIQERIPMRNVEESTRRTYSGWFTKFKEYGKIRYFSDITERNIIEYDEWLHRQVDANGEPLLKQSTIKNRHKFLRLFIEDAKIFGHVKSNPYESSRIKIERGDSGQVDYLTIEQLHRIEEMQFVGYMEHAKDLFLMQCYTGMSYSDLFNINKESCTHSEYGYVYTNQRCKTKQRFTFLVLHEAQEILDKYDWHLPHINNSSYNVWLKVIGQIIGVPKLHSHQGRGAFATIALNRGLDLHIVQKILGHADLQMTQRYATVLNTSIIEQMHAKLG